MISSLINSFQTGNSIDHMIVLYPGVYYDSICIDQMLCISLISYNYYLMHIINETPSTNSNSMVVIVPLEARHMYEATILVHHPFAQLFCCGITFVNMLSLGLTGLNENTALMHSASEMCRSILEIVNLVNFSDETLDVAMSLFNQLCTTTRNYVCIYIKEGFRMGIDKCQFFLFTNAVVTMSTVSITNSNYYFNICSLNLNVQDQTRNNTEYSMEIGNVNIRYACIGIIVHIGASPISIRYTSITDILPRREENNSAGILIIVPSRIDKPILTINHCFISRVVSGSGITLEPSTIDPLFISIALNTITHTEHWAVNSHHFIYNTMTCNLLGSVPS